jgi:hypothetical protein
VVIKLTLSPVSSQWLDCLDMLLALGKQEANRTCGCETFSRTRFQMHASWYMAMTPSCQEVSPRHLYLSYQRDWTHTV